MNQKPPPAAGHPTPGEEPSSRKRPNQRWVDLIEEQIRAAQEQGGFDHLPGAGKPLKLDENPYAGDRALAFHLLQSNGLLPRELDLPREIDADLARANALLAEFRRRRDALAARQRPSSHDPLARWRLSQAHDAQQRYQTLREQYRQRYETALGEIRSKMLTLNIIAPSTLHRRVLDVEAQMQAFDTEFPPHL